jgi:hypothetical protein
MNNLLNQNFEEFKENYGYNEVNTLFNEKLTSLNNTNDDDIDESDETFYLNVSDEEIANELVEELLDNFEGLYGELNDSERKNVQDMIIEYYEFLKF